MKTPMQNIIDEFNLLMEDCTHNQNMILIKAIEIVEKKIESEKNEITNAYVAGRGDAVREHVEGFDGLFKDSEDYYTKLFN